MNRAIVVCACLAIALGVFFRIYALDRPLFWQDEVATEIHVTGHDDATYGKIFDGKIHPLAEIRAFGDVDPARNALDVMRAVAREDPQHVPVYYMLERVAIGFIGTSISAMRALSVLCGVVAIGLSFVLGRQLAGCRAGVIAASLVALSPLFILMSRQSREYALFTDATLLATIVFIAAMRDGRARLWFAYALSVSLGVYCDSLFPLIAIGHGIAAVALCERRLRPVIAWFAATLAAAITFVPWLVSSAGAQRRASGSEEWIKSTYSATILLEKMAFNFGALVFDGEYAFLRLAFFAIAGILAGVLAIAVGLRDARSYARWIPLAIALPTPLALGTIDVIARAHFVTVPRYLVGTWVGFDVAIAIGIACALARPRFRAAALSAWLVLLGLGVASAAIRGGAENWWDDGDGIAYQAVARAIDMTPQPLIVSENRWNTPLELSRYVRSDSQFLLLDFDRGVPPLPAGRSAFVVAPPATELDRLVASRPYRITNVAPANRSNLQTFSRAAHTPASADNALRPENALWLLREVRNDRP